jgi:Domain of unknown function (DUF1905)
MMGRMEWTFTGEVIEWRGPAPYLFVAMTPEESEDLREAARGLIYWGQVPVHVTIGDTEFTTALFPGDGRYLVPVKVGGAASGGDRGGRDRRGRLASQRRAPGMTSGWNCASLTTRSSRSRWPPDETPRTTRGAHGEREAGAHLRRCEHRSESMAAHAVGGMTG